MDYSEELRAIMRRLPEIYRAGDVQGYLAHYAPDLSASYSGVLANSEEARKFMMSLFEGDGKTLKFEMGIPKVQFSESTDAAVVSYPWREHFQYPDGHQTDIEYYETDVWLRRNGEWKIANVHQSTIKEHPIST
jgi:ketosteroid isomerase-like protein